MDILLEELTAGLPDSRQLVRLIVRLIIAMLLGAAIGVQRERIGKPAGMRTHVLVSLGAALIVLAPMESGMNLDGLSRVIQGLVTGIGFIGTGAILKLHDEQDIQGLTTAAGIWLTSAVGVAVGLGRLGLAVLSTILTLITLSVLVKIEIRVSEHVEKEKDGENRQ